MSEFSADRSLVARVHWQRLGLLAAFLARVHAFSTVARGDVVCDGSTAPRAGVTANR